MRSAYRRWASVYDTVFGGVSASGRRRAVAAVNELPGQDVLEVGVGTGLALPHYLPQKRVTGIDLSSDMLDRARARVAARAPGQRGGAAGGRRRGDRVRDGQFDIAVAMFVASVVPNPRRLLDEMRRVVKPGGTLLFVNHFAATGGARLAVERAMAPAGRALGWHPDFKTEALLPPEDCRARDQPPGAAARAFHPGAAAERAVVARPTLIWAGGRLGPRQVPLGGEVEAMMHIRRCWRFRGWCWHRRGRRAPPRRRPRMPGSSACRRRTARWRPASTACTTWSTA